MRKMKKINGYLVVRFNDREKREYEGTALGNFGVIDAELYEDAKINIELIIDDTETQTKYERYAVLREIFRTPGQNVPRPVSIVSEDTAAHGVEKVIFKKLTHKGENKKAQLTASLELWEYIPQTITATSASKSSGSSSGSGSKTPASSGSLSGGYQDYLGSDRGTAPTDDAGKAKAMEAKRNRSPAVDDAATKMKAKSALGRINKMPY